MITVSVWVLVFFMPGYREGGPAVIDNVATVEECQRVGQLLPGRGTYFRCIEVRKVKP